MALTKKQEQAFAQIYVGSIALHNELAFEDYKNLSYENVSNIDILIRKKALSILKEKPSITSTDAIVDYVIKNY